MVPTDALTLLKDRLVSRLSDDYEDTFASSNGADAVLQDQATAAADVGKPYLAMWVESTARSEQAAADEDGLQVTIAAEAHADDSSGAIVGTANPTASDTLLSKALQEIVREDYVWFLNQGLYDIRCSGPGEKTEDDEDGIAHVNTHRITFHLFN